MPSGAHLLKEKVVDDADVMIVALVATRSTVESTVGQCEARINV